MIEGDDCNFQEGDASNLHELKDHSFDLVLSRTLLLSVLLVLAGCGLSHHGHHPGDAAIDNQEPAIAKQNSDAIDQCEKLYPGSHRKPVSPRVKCFNEATLAYYAGFAEIQRSGSARAFTNKMTAIAKKYDAGQISESEFDAEKEEAITDFTNQITQRSDSAANVNATQVQASKQATLLPKQIIAILEARKDIRIVFTDIDMPGSMDGLKLARAIRDRWPPIELILTSGHFDLGDRDIPERGRFFPKSYRDEEIISVLHEFAS